MAKKQGDSPECCPLFTEALHAKGSICEAFGVPLKQGEKWTERYVFQVPAKGRGGARTPTRNLVLEHCPFCGAPPRAGEKPDPSRLSALLEKGKEKVGEPPLRRKSNSGGPGVS